MTMQEIFSRPNSFIKGCLARNSEGDVVSYLDRHAVSFCLVGAARRIYGKPYTFDVIEDYIKEHYPDRRRYFGDSICVLGFNNHPDTTIDEIRKLCKELNI